MQGKGLGVPTGEGSRRRSGAPWRPVAALGGPVHRGRRCVGRSDGLYMRRGHAGLGPTDRRGRPRNACAPDDGEGTTGPWRARTAAWFSAAFPVFEASGGEPRPRDDAGHLGNHLLGSAGGGGSTSSLPRFLDGSLDAMSALEEEEALGFTFWRPETVVLEFFWCRD
jgi:hypothetical protein